MPDCALKLRVRLSGLVEVLPHLVRGDGLS